MKGCQARNISKCDNIHVHSWVTALVQLLVVSADPYMRYRIRSDGDYKADSPMLGLVAGKVLETNVPEWKVGDLFGAELPYIDIQAP